MMMKVAQSCLTLCIPMDYTVHGILQARILKWVAYPFSRGSSGPRNQTGGLLHCRQILYQLSYQGSPQLPGELCVGSRQIKMSLKSCLPEKKPTLHYLIMYIWGKNYKYILANIRENLFSEHSPMWGKR